MNVVSLCSGVGLLDLGLEWAGMRTVQFCERDPYCQRILNTRYPGTPVHDDAWTVEPAECDVIAAGFPCQPFSVAGRGLGADDPRHLWPAIARSVRLVRPRYVILENVPGLLARGFGDVLGDLAAAGFDAEWTVFGANQVGAPHRRNRVWVVATSDADRGRVWDESGGFFRQGWGSSALAWKHDEARTVADADCERRDGRTRGRTGRWAELADGGRTGGGSWWSSERGLGRVAPRQPRRVDRLRALGNAVVPACAELVGLRLLQLDGGRETWLVNR